MARDLTPIVKRSRREGVALHPKAHKVMVKRKNPPGLLTGMRSRRPTAYGLQLREKQKLKRMYGLLEKQFRRLLAEAEKQPGVTGEMLLQLLERRLDNVAYRAHLAPSRQAARQLVTHGHLQVNGRRVDIPSLRVKLGDVITVKARSLNNPYFKQILQTLAENAPAMSWLKLNPKNLEIKITGMPTREEAEPEINEQLIVEFYSR